MAAELTLVSLYMSRFSVCPELDIIYKHKGYILPEGVVEYLLVAQCDSSAEWGCYRSMPI